MTKALSCARCGTIRTLKPDGSITTCDCGTVKGWWVDRPSGTARLYTEGQLGHQYARFVGFHNGFLQRVMALTPPIRDDVHRELHALATQSPGYLFDEGKRGCWAVVIVPGESADTRWASDAEWAVKVQDDAARLVEQGRFAA